LYGAETWVLCKADEFCLGDFERKILRRIYGCNVMFALENDSMVLFTKI
jgi:hypothetical protein